MVSEEADRTHFPSSLISKSRITFEWPCNWRIWADFALGSKILMNFWALPDAIRLPVGLVAKAYTDPKGESSVYSTKKKLETSMHKCIKYLVVA